MRAGPPDWDEVRDDLLIGSCPYSGGDLLALRGCAATAVLSLQHPECYGALGIDRATLQAAGSELGLVMAYQPMRDFDPADQARRLPKAVRSLHKLLDAGHRVYLHCTAGINRSPLVALAYLALVEGETEARALALIRSRRRQAAPSREAYREGRRLLAEANLAQIERRSAALRRDHPAWDARELWEAAERQIIRRAIVGS